MNKPITTLLQREMSRKEFLMTVGFGTASVMGFSTIIKLLTGKSADGRFGHVISGYGSSAYGGSANPKATD